MGNYLVDFSVYTLAMIGVIFAALFAFKTFSTKCLSNKSSKLNVEDSIGLSARKTLYIINVENERFLIAADTDKTSLIAKLSNETSPIKSHNLHNNELKITNETQTPKIREDKSLRLSSLNGIDSIDDFSSIIDFKKEKAKKDPVMRELARKLNIEKKVPKRSLAEITASLY